MILLRVGSETIASIQRGGQQVWRAWKSAVRVRGCRSADLRVRIGRGNGVGLLISERCLSHARLAPPAFAAAFCLAATGGLAADPVTLTLYSAQHEQTVNMLIDGFTKATGIKVVVHQGEAPEIANQIAEEGSSSPADVYFTENSPELVLLEEKGLLAQVDKSTLAQVPARFSSPNGAWVGVLARENVIVYNPGLIKESELARSLLDLAKPVWKGKLALAPADADFLPLTAAVAAVKGKPAALDWLKGLKENAQIYEDDEGVVAAVDRGSAAVGVVNSYYWERYRAETGNDKVHSAIHHFSGGDVGGLIVVSGAAVLKSSRHQEAGQKFLAYLVSRPVQEQLGKSEVDFEYPLAEGVPANPALKPFNELEPPPLDVTQLGDDRQAAELLRDAGLL